MRRRGNPAMVEEAPRLIMPGRTYNGGQHFAGPFAQGQRNHAAGAYLFTAAHTVGLNPLYAPGSDRPLRGMK